MTWDIHRIEDRRGLNARLENFSKLQQFLTMVLGQFRDLSFKHWVIGDFEALHDIRLQPGIGPYPAHTQGRYTHRFGDQRAAPVRCIGRALR